MVTCVLSMVGPIFDNLKSETLATHFSWKRVFVVLTSRWIIVCLDSINCEQLQCISQAFASKVVVIFGSCIDAHAVFHEPCSHKQESFRNCLHNSRSMKQGGDNELLKLFQSQFETHALLDQRVCFHA